MVIRPSGGGFDISRHQRCDAGIAPVGIGGVARFLDRIARQAGRGPAANNAGRAQVGAITSATCRPIDVAGHDRNGDGDVGLDAAADQLGEGSCAILSDAAPARPASRMVRTETHGSTCR